MTRTAPLALIGRLAQHGRAHPMPPEVAGAEPLARFVRPPTTVLQPDAFDGSLHRREVLTRYLLLMAVLDQGPDIHGLRRLLAETTTHLYRREVRFLHTPATLFAHVGLAVDTLLNMHEGVKALRAQAWAEANQSRESDYYLFKYDSQGKSQKTTPLHYLAARWGAPLLLAAFVQQEAAARGKALPWQPYEEGGVHPTPLVDYLEHWPSAERMSQALKRDPRYGLGKAIGDKAAHLFAKWFVSTFGLSRRRDPGWGPLSYELPLDSNAGRVLWRTGFWLSFVSEAQLVRWEVLQPGQGKGGTVYLRVTNLRGKTLPRDAVTQEEWDAYVRLVREHLRVMERPQKVHLHRLPQVYLALWNEAHPHHAFSVADLDDGLMHIGTTYCLNHEAPHCATCPLQESCLAYQEAPELIQAYRT